MHQCRSRSTLFSSVLRLLGKSEVLADERAIEIDRKTGEVQDITNMQYINNSDATAFYKTIKELPSVTSWDVLLPGATYRGNFAVGTSV